MSRAICSRNSVGEANFCSSRIFRRFQLQFLAVKFAVKIQQVRLDAKLRFAGRNGRTQTDIERDAINCPCNFVQPE